MFSAQLLSYQIDHFHYDVNTQRIVIVVVKSAGTFFLSSIPISQGNRDGGNLLFLFSNYIQRRNILP